MDQKFKEINENHKFSTDNLLNKINDDLEIKNESFQSVCGEINLQNYSELSKEKN